MRFTDFTIQALKPKEKRYDVFENGSMGLHVRITPRGVKTFGFRYSYKGKAKRLSIGRYPKITLRKAHKEANEARELTLANLDPRQKQVSDDERYKTMCELSELYIENYAKTSKATWKEDQDNFRLHIPNNWHDRRANDITSAEVYDLLEKIKNDGKGPTSNKIKALLSVIFNYAKTKGYVDASPVWGIKRLHKPRKGDRVLSPKEIRYFWNKIEESKTSKPMIYVLKLMLITGQRACEVRQMTIDQLDFDNKTWTIPRANTKTKRHAHRIPLTYMAIQMIKEAFQLHKEYDYIFNRPNQGNDHFKKSDAGQAIRRFIKFSKIEKFTPHDLRRTFATHCTSNKVPRQYVKYVLGHSETDVTDHYDIYQYDDEKSQVLSQWEIILNDILAGKDIKKENKMEEINTRETAIAFLMEE